MLNKIFIIPFKINIRILFILNLKFLVLDVPNYSKKYFYIPKNIQINKKNKKLYFLFPKITKYSSLFQLKYLSLLAKQIYNLKKKYFKTVLIRGVGLKITYLEANINVLQLKLGFSHLVFIAIPKNIQVLILKRKIIIQGNSASAVGNFSVKIMNFKKIDIFTGKGLWLKNIQKFYCKPVKKR